MTYHQYPKDNHPALYTKPKPEYRNQDLPYPDDCDKEDEDKWQSTFHSLLVEPEFKVGDITAMPGNIKARVYYIEGTVIYVTAPFTPLEIMCSNLLYFLGIRKIVTCRRIRKRKKDGH